MPGQHQRELIKIISARDDRSRRSRDGYQQRQVVWQSRSEATEPYLSQRPPSRADGRGWPRHLCCSTPRPCNQSVGVRPLRPHCLSAASFIGRCKSSQRAETIENRALYRFMKLDRKTLPASMVSIPASRLAVSLTTQSWLMKRPTLLARQPDASIDHPATQRLARHTQSIPLRQHL